MKKLTKKQMEWFERNFDAVAMNKAMDQIHKIAIESHSAIELWNNLEGFDRTSDNAGDVECFMVDIEINRSRMATAADYVGISVYMEIGYENSDCLITSIELYTSDTPTGEVEPICLLDPVTLEPVKWTYGK